MSKVRPSGEQESAWHKACQGSFEPVKFDSSILYETLYDDLQSKIKASKRSGRFVPSNDIKLYHQYAASLTKGKQTGTSYITLQGLALFKSLDAKNRKLVFSTNFEPTTKHQIESCFCRFEEDADLTKILNENTCVVNTKTFRFRPCEEAKPLIAHLVADPSNAGLIDLLDLGYSEKKILKMAKELE